MEKSICFAYFANGEFLGWYGDSLGSICTIPKIYHDSEEQRKIVMKNFRSKMKSIKQSTYAEEKIKGVDAISLLKFQGESVLKDKSIELRIVDYPICDELSLDFDHVKDWCSVEPVKFLEIIEDV